VNFAALTVFQNKKVLTYSQVRFKDDWQRSLYATQKKIGKYHFAVIEKNDPKVSSLKRSLSIILKIENVS
jgi:hypothetical protein